MINPYELSSVQADPVKASRLATEIPDPEALYVWLASAEVESTNASPSSFLSFFSPPEEWKICLCSNFLPVESTGKYRGINFLGVILVLTHPLPRRPPQCCSSSCACAGWSADHVGSAERAVRPSPTPCGSGEMRSVEERAANTIKHWTRVWAHIKSSFVPIELDFLRGSYAHLGTGCDVLPLLICQGWSRVWRFLFARIVKTWPTCAKNTRSLQQSCENTTRSQEHNLRWSEPGSRIPEAMHSNTRRRASPGDMLAPPLLTHFSTSSSIACNTNCPSENVFSLLHSQGFQVSCLLRTYLCAQRIPGQRFDRPDCQWHLQRAPWVPWWMNISGTPYPLIQWSPCRYTLTKVSQDAYHHDAGLKPVCSSLL